MTNLTFRRYNNPRWPADRAMRDADCWTFKIYHGDMLVREFNQFDPRMDVTGDYKDTYREARAYADRLADTLKVDRPKLVTMVKKEIKKVEWVEACTPIQEMR